MYTLELNDPWDAVILMQGLRTIEKTYEELLERREKDSIADQFDPIQMEKTETEIEFCKSELKKIKTLIEKLKKI